MQISMCKTNRSSAERYHYMDEKRHEDVNTDTDAASKIIAAGIGILSASVLAYCGYKIINNQLTKTEYESDPNKVIE